MFIILSSLHCLLMMNNEEKWGERERPLTIGLINLLTNSIIFMAPNFDIPDS